MRSTPVCAAALGSFAVVLVLAAQPVLARSRAASAVQETAAQIPKSIKSEHDAIHTALVGATKASGRTGAAARELARVLDPHFEREEQIALPPLGVMAALASGQRLSETTSASMLRMTATLRSEMPRMLAEHQRIRAAVEALRLAAVSENVSAAAALADELARHAQTEEEVLYPAALLVGDLIRARTSK